MKRLCAILIVGLLMMPVFSEVAKASSYRYSGKVYVSNSYRYVGFTPQEITIKTKWKVPKDFFTCTWQFRTLKIDIYVYYNHAWHKEDSKTYYNHYGSLSDKPSSKQFDYAWSMYRPHWWYKTSYWKFKVKIDKDRGLIFHCGFPHKIKVTLSGKACIFTHKNIFSLPWEDFTVTGWSKKFSIRHTPYSKYRDYWGLSMSAQDYNTLMNEVRTLEQQYGTYQETFFEKYDRRDIAIMVLTAVAIIAGLFTFASYKRKRS